MQVFFLSDFEWNGNINFALSDQRCLLVCGRMSSLAFYQRTFDWGGEMALVVEESVGTGQ